MPGQDVSLHRVRGLVSGANWRATKFATAVPPRLTCGLCRVISQTTVLLPCFHTLCESCLSHSVNDGNAVCPFDEEPFTVGDCQKFQLPPDTAEKLKACCWNESRGCTFVGTLQAVLAHYEQHCTFHVVSCPRCNATVLQRELPSHYRSRCHDDAIVLAPEQPTLHQGLVLSPGDVRTCLDELKALIRDPYQDRLPALQSKLNEVLEEARNIGTQVEEITRAFSVREHRLTQSLGDLSVTFGQELRSLGAALCHNLKKHCDVNTISHQVRYNCIQIDAVARTLSDSDRRLRDRLTESRNELSTIFGQELRSQLCELSARLTKISEIGRNDAREPEKTGTSGMPWKLEKRHILRKLELVATDSQAYLELLRLRADQQLKQPVAEYTPFFPSRHKDFEVRMSPVMGSLESQEKGYIVSLANIDDMTFSGKLISQFTRWYRRDSYLQVATWFAWVRSEIFLLGVYLKWGGTRQGSCSAPHKAHVCVRHPDHPVKQDVTMTNLSTDSESELGRCGFQDIFVVTLQNPKHSGFVKEGRLTFVVAFQNTSAES